MKKTPIILLAFLLLPTISTKNDNLLNISKNPKHFLNLVNESLFEIEKNSFENKTIKDNIILKDSKNNKYLYLSFKETGYLLVNENKEIERYDFNNYLDIKNFNTLNDDFLNKMDITYTFESDSSFEYSAVGSTSVVEYNDLLSYMKNRTGKNDIEIVGEGKLRGLTLNCSDEGLSQMEESVFVQAGTGNSEGNCGIVSISNIIKYYSRYKDKIYLPRYDSKTIIKPYEEIPSIYPLANTEGYVPKDEEVEISTIVSTVRKHAIEKGYIISGMNDEKTSYAFLETCKDYNYQNSLFNGLNNYNVATIKNEIENNRPLQLRTIDDDIYGGHGMMITGYKTFKYTRKLKLLTLTVNITAVSVFDGHSKKERWVDLNMPASQTGIPERAKSMSIALMNIE